MKRNTFLDRLNPFAPRATRSANRRRPFSPRRRLSLESLEQRTLLSVNPLVVTSDADTVDPTDGVLTLREAIVEANVDPDTDTIAFNINGGGAQTITLGVDPLPTITETVIIEGSTQPEVNGSSLITIDAVNVDPTKWAVMGLSQGAGGSKLRNFRIINVPNTGIVLDAEKNVLDDENIYVENLNLDLSGAGSGIHIRSDWNRILGTAVSAPSFAVQIFDANENIVKDCDLHNSHIGVHFVSNSSNNLIQHNYASGAVVGVDSDNLTGTGNRIIENDFSNTTGGGIGLKYGEYVLEQGDKLLVVKENVFKDAGTAVSFTGLHDIDLVADPDFFDIDVTTVKNGLVLNNAENVTIDGFDLSGDGTRWEKCDVGLRLSGTGITVRNIIAQNRYIGIRAWNLTYSEISHADLSWTAAGPSPGERISYGLIMSGESNVVHDVLVENHSAGMYLSGTSNVTVYSNEIVNNTFGLSLSHSSGIQIQDNSIYSNAKSGIAVSSDSSGIRIQRNSIHSNGGLGIDLAPNGVTLNDPADADTGANSLQNFPVLSDVSGGAATRVQGTLNSTSNTEFTLDFYASSEADPSGYGEGERWLGAITVTTDANGNASFDEILPAMTIPGEVITATATDPDGNTSEFSAAMAVQGSMVEIDVKPGSDPNAVNLNSNGVIAVAILADANFDPSCVQVDTVVFAGAYAAQHAFEDVDADGDLDLVMHFRIEDTNLEEIYQQLLADDQDADGVLDSTHQEVQAWLFGQTTLDELFAGVDEMDVFLSGKHLRELLDELFGAGTP